MLTEAELTLQEFISQMTLDCGGAGAREGGCSVMAQRTRSLSLGVVFTSACLKNKIAMTRYVLDMPLQGCLLAKLDLGLMPLTCLEGPGPGEKTSLHLFPCLL